MIASRPIDDLHRSGLRPFDYYTAVYPTRPKLRHRGRVFVAGRDQGGTAGGAIDRRGPDIIAPASLRSGRTTEKSTDEKTRRRMAVLAAGKGFHANEW